MTTTKHRPKKPREITRKGKQDRTAPHLERSQPAEKRQRSGQGRARRSPRGQDDDGDAGSPLRPRDWAPARAGSSSADAAVTPLGLCGGQRGREARARGARRPRNQPDPGSQIARDLPGARSREISRVAGHAREFQDEWHLCAWAWHLQGPGMVCKGSGPRHPRSKAVAFQEGEGPKATALMGEPHGPNP